MLLAGAWRFLVLSGGVLLAGCSSNGSYDVTWAFSTAGFAPGSCGAHGVSAIAIVATDESGNTDSPIAPCAPGSFTRGLSPGTWTLALTALDGTGHVKATAPNELLLRGQTTVTVVEDQLATAGPVLLPPLPECGDGVDNDLDGRVDLDDPDCMGDLDGPHECVSTADHRCPESAP